MATKKKTQTRKAPARAPAKPKTFEGTIDSIADKFTATGVTILKTLDGAKAELAPLVEIHEQLTGAIAARREELSTLGEIGDAAEKLEELRLQVQADTELHQGRLDGFREAERDEQARIAKEREREQDAYEYETNRYRDRTAEEFKERMERARADARRERDQLQVEQEDIAKAQEALTAREAEVDAKLPTAIEEAVKSERARAAIAANAAERNHKLALRELELKLEQREQRVEDLTRALSDAAVKLEAAEARAAEVAQRAIDASSGRAALEALQRQSQASAGGNGRRG